jgi:hypothetical protein
MIVKCIDNISRASSLKFSITPGKNYEVIEVGRIPFSSLRPFDFSGKWYKIEDDKGEVRHFGEENVRPLNVSEIRELKLKELGI